jgi:DNA primase
MDDIDRLRRETSLSDLAHNEGVSLQKNGQEWEGLCPFHQETNPSFTIFTGKDGVERFHCFGCNERGDVVDFVEKLKGVSKRDAILYLGGGKTAPNVAPRQIKEPRDPYAGIELLTPPREITKGQKVEVYNPKRADDPDRRWGSFIPSAIYPYMRADGSILGYVLRHDLRDGKETPMVCWVRLPDGTECWSRFPFPKPRPIYRAEWLREGQVIIAEGEKCADRIAATLGRQTVSWAGGTFGVDHTDWSALAGRSVVIWPDADKVGLSTADRLAAILHDGGCTVRVLGVLVAA